MRDPLLLQSLLKPYDAEQMEVYPVSPLVGNVKNDVPACIEEVFIGKNLSSWDE
jgi:putative SOS response-associated peptidase YedK